MGGRRDSVEGPAGLPKVQAGLLIRKAHLFKVAPARESTVYYLQTQIVF